MSDPNCWEWNSYIGECIKWHKAPWWDYPNVWSISTVIIVALFAFWLFVSK